MTDFDTAYDRLECPHSGSCSYQEPMWSVTACTREDALAVDVECNNCHGADHLIFDVGDYDYSRMVEFDVGDEFTVEESLRGPRRVNVGDRGKVTAIADNPLYSADKPVVGVVFGVDGSSPYPAHLFQLDTFEKLIGDSIVFD